MPHPLSLNPYLGTLAGDLGCFPLGSEAYPPLPDSRRVYQWYSEFGWDRYACKRPYPFSALPPRYYLRGYPERYFGENQISPSLIGLSPLSTAHPRTFQRSPVRTSRACYHSFILAMDSSPGFGSAPRYCAPY